MVGILTGNPIWDALGSVVIGLLLIVVSFLLAYEVKSLLVGEAPNKQYRTDIERHFLNQDSEMKILKFIALVTGNSEILVSIKILPGKNSDTSSLISSINAAEKAIKLQFPEIKWLFVEPDTKE